MKLPAWQKKLPKKVTICGRVYKIGYNMLRGAAFNCGPGKIMVGCDCARDVALESLIHEISEIVHVEMGFRFYRRQGENGDMMFVMNHVKFQQHNLLMVAALMDCGLLK